MNDESEKIVNCHEVTNRITSEAGQIFAMGYTGKAPTVVSAIVDELKAVIVDVRFSPKSRVPHWTGEFLAMSFGNRYVHIREFGNLNYKTGGEIKIMNFNAGLTKLKSVLKKSNVILLCACQKPDHCHRRLLAKLLTEKLQIKYEEVILTGRGKGTPKITQLSLF